MTGGTSSSWSARWTSGGDYRMFFLFNLGGSAETPARLPPPPPLPSSPRSAPGPFQVAKNPVVFASLGENCPWDTAKKFVGWLPHHQRSRASLWYLTSRPSDLVCRRTPSVGVPKACFKGKEKMPKRAGVRWHNLVTQLLMSKGLDMLSSYWIAVFMSL